MSGVQKRGAGTNRASYPSGALRVCRACVGWWIEYESEAHVRWESKRFLGGGLGCFVVLGGFLVCSSLALRVGVGFLGGGSGWYGGLACASGWYGGLACASGWCGVLRWRFGVVWGPRLRFGLVWGPRLRFGLVWGFFGGGLGWCGILVF